MAREKKNEVPREEIFENYPVPRAVLTFALPTIFNALMTTIYNLVDTFWISKTNSAAMVAGVSMGMSGMILLTAVGNLFSVGGSSLISRCLGSKDLDKARRTSSFCIYAGILLGLLIGAVLWVIRTPFSRMLGATDDSLLYTEQYIVWVMCVGALPTLLSSILGAHIRAIGYSKAEMTGMVTGHIINFILDPVFILAFHWGVVGAAVATTLSNLIAVIYFVWFIARMGDNTVLNAQPANARPDRALLTDLFSVGIPSALDMFLSSFSMIVFNNVLGIYGDNYIAAMGIIQKLDNFPVQFASGFTNGSVPMIGYNYAAKNYDRMEETRRYATRMTFIISCIFLVIYEVFAKQLFCIFMSDGEIVSIGTDFLRIYVLCVPVMTLIFTVRSIFTAIGKGLITLFISLLRRGLIFVPLIYLFNALFGVYGVVSTQIAVDLISVVIAFAIYYRFRKQLYAEIAKE